MAKKKRNNGRPFVMIYKSVLKSQAYEQLSPTEFRAYVHIKANHNGSNNGEIPCPYSQLEGIMARATISRALKGLENKGWIERNKCGGMCRYYRLYKLTWKYDVKR